MKSLIRSWFAADDAAADEHGALRDLVDALDRLEPDQARYLAQFAYLLGRVAHADQHVGPEEIRTMEALLRHEGNLPDELAVLVVALARTSNRMFGGTDNFIVARDFAAHATYAQRVALLQLQGAGRIPGQRPGPPQARVAILVELSGEARGIPQS